MKKYVALLLCLLLIFSFGVPSFATETSGSVTVTNFPAYFTGAYDRSIDEELISINHLLDTYLADIWINTDQLYDYAIDIYNHMLEFDALAAQQFIVQGEFFLHVKEHLENMYLYDQLTYNYIVSTLNFDMNKGFEDVVSAVNGTTGAVNSNTVAVEDFHSSFTDFGQTWEDEFLMKDNPGTVGYQLKMLQAVLADEEDLKMKQASADAEEGLFENFVSPSGKGSVGSADMGSLLDLSSWFSGFTGGYSSAKPNDYLGTSLNSFNQVFNDTSDSSPFAWFTQANADAMDTVVASYGRNVNPATSPVLATHYYEDKVKELESIKEMFRFD